MSMQLVNRNNVVAGAFLLASIVLAVAISFILSDIGDKFGSKTTYVFRFPTSVGVTGLQPGAEVTFGGLAVGKVKSIAAHNEKDPQTGSEVTVAHDVTVALVSDLVIYEDAYADLALPMLGGVSKINIPSAGSGPYEGGPPDPNPILDEGEMLRGRFAPSILAQLGFSTEYAVKIQQTIDNVKEITTNVSASSASVKRMTAALEPGFVGGVDDGTSAIANLRRMTERFNGEDGWSSRVDSILQGAQSATAKVEPTIDDARSAINEARGVISDSKPRVASILEHVEEMTRRVRYESMGRIDELLEKGSLALGSYKDLAQNANAMLDENRPKVATAIESARDIGVNGELFLQEIRAQPWRLLKKPSKEDLEREPIYEAAKAYADAVSDLRAASEALDAAVGRASRGGSAADASELAEIARVVEGAYGRYELAERGLLERLRIKEPTTQP